MTAESILAPSLADNWWLNDGEGLSKAIERFNNPLATDEGPHVPVSTVRDAAAVQRQLLLRQSIAGFTARTPARLSSLAKAAWTRSIPWLGLPSAPRRGWKFPG